MCQIASCGPILRRRGTKFHSSALAGKQQVRLGLTVQNGCRYYTRLEVMRLVPVSDNMDVVVT